jgi:5'-3' exonuclease
MGIPSYFRRIIQKYPGIVSERITDCNTLCFDFNCLVYRCIRENAMANLEVPPIHDVDATHIWENALLREVRRVVKEVWVEAGRPSQVYIAVDGVVPMAKIRQQRVRRFKSAYLRKLGGWDTNSITPGTSFMAKLNKELESLVKEQSRGNSWILSGSDEPGEGEHKIMNWLRTTGTRQGSICIYGLDADLILLSMLTGEMIEHKNIWLLRERQEFGGMEKEKKADDPQRYTFLNIEELKLRIGVRGVDEVLNYVGIMSLMGNDFLPHSLTHKLNDDGHEAVLDALRMMKRTKKWLVNSEGVLQSDVLLEICRAWSGDEEDRILHTIRKKREQAGRGVARGMDESEGLPLKWDVEKVLMSGDGRDSRLIKNWREEYWKWIHPFADRKEVCGEYVFGLQWILDYYTGLRLCSKFWLFSSWLPPLWSDLARFLEGGDVCRGGRQAEEEQNPIQPEEQLAMVLPLDSWGLIRDKNLRNLPILQPQLWPLKYSFFSAGRRWLWECEARVPILTAERLRDILKSGD